ncbi:MAG: VOC family protein [Pseudomonadales bacterium]|jgi:catechol 2,3-dioxygenase-like lactoylglutathione lyase family enzyme
MFGFPHHIDLTVSDLERSVGFYETVLSELGFQRSEMYSGGAPCWISGQIPGAVFSIAIKRARDASPHNRYAPGLHHLAFAADSREAVDRFHGFLVRKGIEVLDAPAEYDYTPGYYAVFFSDPDGIKLELVYEPHPERTDA